MLNDRSSALSLLQTRRSGKPRVMSGPGPTAEELERILAIAVRTPDHGKLNPWRFVVVEQDKRDAFAALLREALVEELSCVTAAHHRKEEDLGTCAWAQNSGVGAGAFVRSRGDEPPPRLPCAGLCRRLGHRLARLLAAGH
jgi:nitroreductase